MFHCGVAPDVLEWQNRDGFNRLGLIRRDTVVGMIPISGEQVYRRADQAKKKGSRDNTEETPRQTAVRRQTMKREIAGRRSQAQGQIVSRLEPRIRAFRQALAD